MELKYYKNDHGYIIDRKFTNHSNLENINTFKSTGHMELAEFIPTDNENLEKSITEFTFDSMKEKVLTKMKREFSIKDDDIVNFFFKGNINKNSESKVYARFKEKDIPVTETNFILDFEVELKVKPTNFFKIKLNNMIYNTKSI